MAAYVTSFEKILQFYNRGEYKVALDLLNALPYQVEIPKDKEWSYHQAMGLCLYFQGDMQNSLTHWEAIWKNPGDISLENLQIAYSNYLMYLHYLEGISDEALRDAHFHYQDYFAGYEMFSHTDRRRKKDKLRIGYLSPDIVDHIVTNFSVQLFALHDNRRFEAVLYNVGDRTNEVTDWLYSLSSGGRNLYGLPSQEAARQIYEDEVDILVDLSGHCGGGRTLQIAAYKPAPVQMCGIGYFDTTGLTAMDYILGDVHCDSIGQERFFREKIIRLPHSHLCYTPSERFAADRPAYEVHTPLTFGSFNNFAKITDEALLAWRTILERVPDSRLILKNIMPLLVGLQFMKKRLRQLDFPMERVEVRPGSPDYLRDYQEVDIILDTCPYPGGGTTCEALYQGIPVINRHGTRHGSRFSYSLLTNLGLGEYSVTTWEEYCERAISLANDHKLLQAMHWEIPEIMKKSSLMNGADYVRDVEEAYVHAWQSWIDSE